MGANYNSIRACTTKDEVKSSIRLQLSADIRREKIIIVVEGRDDVLFFKTKVTENIILQESYSGKQGVMELVDDFDDERVIGVCDRDYDEISSNSRIYYYDYNSLEMMLVANNSVLEIVYGVYCNNVVSAIEKRDEILIDLRFLSSFRKMNAQLNWGLNLEKISLSKTFDSVSKRLSNEKIEFEIKNYNARKDISEFVQRVKSSLTEDISLEAMLYETRGHDFLMCLQHIFSIYPASRSNIPSVGVVFRALLCTFNKSELHKTKLYSTITSTISSNIFA